MVTLLSLVSSVSVIAQTVTLDRILAIVNGQVITHSDVRIFIDLRLVDIPAGPLQEVEVLNFLIERRVVLDEVNRFVITEPTSVTVDQHLDLLLNQLPDGLELNLVLDRVGLTVGDLRQLLADEIRRELYLIDRFGVTGDALRQAAEADWVAELVSRAQVRRVVKPADIRE
tara:strand:+ start:19037 stop:19549 length:513 start_codon:yes stop_codon:yes gene_type:complete